MNTTVTESGSNRYDLGGGGQTMRCARRAQRSAAVDGHHDDSVLEWNSYRVAGGVQCAHLKMAAIRRSDAPRARASCRRRGCVRAAARRCAAADACRPWRSRPAPLAARSATCAAAAECVRHSATQQPTAAALVSVLPPEAR